jgi:hypothetical protein
MARMRPLVFALVRGARAPLATIALMFGTGCQHDSTTPNQCPESIAHYCPMHPGACPPSAPEFCPWLTARGGGAYNGPVSCAGVGGGWEVDSQNAQLWYLFDDAGLTAILSVGPDGGGCLAGSGLWKGPCLNEEVAFGCAIDASSE